jgi:hypothetical protein
VKRWNKFAGGRPLKRERFTMLPADLLVAADWTRLPPAARAIFIDMCMLHHHGSEHGSSNNGHIGYGCAAGARAANASPATAHRMLKALCNSCLIKLRKEGVFKAKAGEGRAHEWEITIYPRTGRPAVPYGSRNLRLEHWVLESAGYKGLTNQAKCILIELMRRYDGGNNGRIIFGGPNGACAGFSADVTERALTELERAGFIVQTAPAVPWLSHPRKWRLTMYSADGKQATKDFMRSIKPESAEKSFNGFNGTVDSRQNVSTMRASVSADVPPRPTLPDEISSHYKELRDRVPNFDSRAGETFDAADTRATEIHLEASPPAPGRLAFFASYGPSSERPNFTPASPLTFGPAKISSDTISEEPASLFGDTLPSTSTPLDRLRLELREVLSRRRGTQSRLAEAVGLARPTFANALSGRERFTPTAASALRRWLDGEPVAGDWPPLPSGAEEKNAA